MKNYLFISSVGSNEFKGGLNVILARREAEKRFGGEGGRLFVEIEHCATPPGHDFKRWNKEPTQVLHK